MSPAVSGGGTAGQIADPQGRTKCPLSSLIFVDILICNLKMTATSHCAKLRRISETGGGAPEALPNQGSASHCRKWMWEEGRCGPWGPPSGPLMSHNEFSMRRHAHLSSGLLAWYQKEWGAVLADRTAAAQKGSKAKKSFKVAKGVRKIWQAPAVPRYAPGRSVAHQQ